MIKEGEMCWKQEKRLKTSFLASSTFLPLLSYIMLIEQFDEPLLVVDGDAGFLGFVQFGASVFAGDQVVQVFADAGGHGAAELLDGLFGDRARHAGQASGEQEGLAGQRTIVARLLLLYIESGLRETLDQRAILVVLEPAIDAVPTDLANAGNGGKLFFAGS